MNRKKVVNFNSKVNPIHAKNGDSKLSIGAGENKYIQIDVYNCYNSSIRWKEINSIETFYLHPEDIDNVIKTLQEFKEEFYREVRKWDQ